jgi:hypothetical protein
MNWRFGQINRSPIFRHPNGLPGNGNAVTSGWGAMFRLGHGFLAVYRVSGLRESEIAIYDPVGNPHIRRYRMTWELR